MEDVEMSCRRVKKSLLEYADGGLPHKEREPVRLHLESCPSCAALAEKLEVSRKALSSVETPEMSDAASGRVLAAIKRQEAGAGYKPGAGWLRSRQALALGAAAAVVLVAVFVVVGLQGGKQTGVGELEERAASGTASDSLNKSAAPAPSAAAEQKAEGAASGFSTTVARPLPVVKATSNDYTSDSLRAMVEALPVRKEFADAYTLSDAAVLGGTYAKKAADDGAGQGIDGPELEAMISYITASEPVLLTCYVENAAFNGRGAWIIGFAAPPRSGSSVKLSRTELWVMDPTKFAASPDSSIVFFLEYK